MPVLLINRKQITLPNGVTTTIDTELAWNPLRGPEQLMVIPLIPIATWVNITMGEPYIDPATGTAKVDFTNSGTSPEILNVLFWLPHSIVGPGETASYT